MPKPKPMSPEEMEKYRIKAYGIDSEGKKRKLNVDRLEIRLAGGKMLHIDLVGQPNNRLLPLITGGIASGKRNDHSRFVVHPGCSNILYVGVDKN